MAFILNNSQSLPPEIKRAMSLPPDDAVERKVAETISTFRTKLNIPTLVAPSIVYDLKGHTAGYYVPKTHTIRINIDLLYSDHKDDMIERTVPHEVAHAVQRQLYPRSQSHGREWMRLMWLLGLPAERCHTYDTTPARNRKKMARPFIYSCDCREHRMTKITHTRAQADPHRYICVDCRATLRFKEVRG